MSQTKRSPLPDREVRIRRVSDRMRADLRNISDYLGVSITDLLKPHLGKIIESYPEYMRQEKPSA